MKIEINTTEKTIKLLEDISVNDIIELGSSIKNFEEYKLIQSKEFIYTQPIQYMYYNPYTPINPHIPVFTTSTGKTDVTVATTGSSGITGTSSYYNHNLD